MTEVDVVHDLEPDVFQHHLFTPVDGLNCNIPSCPLILA